MMRPSNLEPELSDKSRTPPQTVRKPAQVCEPTYEPVSTETYTQINLLRDENIGYAKNSGV